MPLDAYFGDASQIIVKILSESTSIAEAVPNMTGTPKVRNFGVPVMLLSSNQAIRSHGLRSFDQFRLFAINGLGFSRQWRSSAPTPCL